MLLLSDGTIMTFSGGNSCYRLTPDIHGSYVNGTWSRLANMHDSREDFSSQVLRDGRVFVAGGEYGTGTPYAEVYDPLMNAWTMTPFGGFEIADAPSEILPNGNVLVAPVYGRNNCSFYDPASNTWSPGPTLVRDGGFWGSQEEASWVKLPDDSILTVDPYGQHSERYIPSLNLWVDDGLVPVALYDTFQLGPGQGVIHEIGAAVLLPDGRAFFLGGTGHTAFYTPSGNANPGTWTAGPDIPSSLCTRDAPAAMLVNGKVLCAVSPKLSGGNSFPAPTTFYEFDPVANSFAQVGTPSGSTENYPSYYTIMLDLPDGTVLYSNGGTQLYVYQPSGSPLTSGKPTITSVTRNVDGSYHLEGTLLNGISEGAAFGDDHQMSGNYPIVRLIDTAGSVYYGRAYNWSSTGVMTGSTPETTEFTLPGNVPVGTYSLVVAANGISSDPISFTVSGGNPPIATTLVPPASFGGSSYTFTVIGSPNTRAHISQSDDLINWTSSGLVTLNNSGQGSFTDSSVGSTAHRFYKVGDGCSATTIGFVKMSVPASTGGGSSGILYFANPLISPVANDANYLMRYIPGQTEIPEGTTISVIRSTSENVVALTFDDFRHEWLDGNGVDSDLTMNPGQGFMIQNSSSTSFTVFFSGSVPQGSQVISDNVSQGVDPINGIPYYGGQFSAISSIIPVSGSLDTLGFPVRVGDTIYQVKGNSVVSSTFTSSGWNPNAPILGIGEAFVIMSGADGHRSWVENYSGCSGVISGPMLAQDGALFATMPDPYPTSFGLHVVRWTKCEDWQLIGRLAAGTNSSKASVMCIGGSGLFVGGSFTNAGGVATTNIARYDLITGRWTGIGDGTLLDEVRAITVDNSGIVYVGAGQVLDHGAAPHDLIKKWNGTAWTSLGGGLFGNSTVTDGRGEVTALGTDGTSIFAAGLFDAGQNGNGTRVNSTNVIKWDGTQWQPMGTPTGNGIPIVGSAEVPWPGISITASLSQAT